MVDKDFDRIIAEYYREMELDLIASMKRNLSAHLKEEADLEFDFPQWQAMKLKELKRYQRQNGRIVAGVGNRVSKEVSKHLLEELSQGSKSEMRRFKEIMGGKYESSVTMKDSFFKINDRKVNSLISALSGDLHKANSAALRMANDTYRDVIFKASFFAANGAKTPKQAIDMATRDFLSRGINCIEYKNGRRVNIASYAQMAVRTASQRAYLIGEGSRRQAEGVPFVKITRHNTACELCRPFEGKILIDDVYSGGKPSDGDYMLMSTAMGAGLFHPNCRHGSSTHYPELDDFEYTPELEEEEAETDEDRAQEDDERAKQLHSEQLMQKYKRHIAGSLDEDNVALYERKLKEAENALESTQTIANSENSGIISSELTNQTNSSSNLIISEEKFLNYALNPDKQPDKALAFKKALGYTIENYQDLIDTIQANADKTKFVNKGSNEYGKLYEFVMRIKGPNGKEANVLTAWIEYENGEIRLTSVYVTQKEVTEK